MLELLNEADLREAIQVKEQLIRQCFTEIAYFEIALESRGLTVEKPEQVIGKCSNCQTDLKIAKRTLSLAQIQELGE